MAMRDTMMSLLFQTLKAAYYTRISVRLKDGTTKALMIEAHPPSPRHQLPQVP